jgi:hypothetical protein
VAAAADHLIPAVPDHSHASLSWSAGDRFLVTHPVPDSSSIRMALDPASLRLAVLGDDSAASHFQLPGVTIDDAYRWVEQALRDAGALAGDAAIPRSDLDLGEGPGRGASPFTFGHAEAFEELTRWFGNASAALEHLRQQHPRASAVRCWPHHFDIAVLLPLDERGGEDARSVGIGMTPGDDTYAEPYFYVTPWPYPPAEVQLPALQSGSWHTEGWTGAVLPGTEIVTAPGDQRGQLVARFLEEAVTHGTALLDR